MVNTISLFKLRNELAGINAGMLAIRQRTQYHKKMTVKNQNITFKRLEKKDELPYELLLLADPSKDLVEVYLKQSDVFTATHNDRTLGVIVLFPLTEEKVEIKNVAVKPEFQRQGIGSYLIENAIQVASFKKQKSICIGTANSSIGQLYLYQKIGFEITEIKKDFFTDNYAEPIYENGIQAKHMLVLTRKLND
jgi:aminoglycoside 6'-N-acetyltransferase I